jgi:protein-disulfide isomerase
MAKRRTTGSPATSAARATRAERRASARADQRARAPQPASARTGGLRRFALPATLLGAGVIAGGIIVAGLGSPAPAAAIVRQSAGSSTAPVVVAEYSDYQCDYCGRWSRDVEAAFRSEFVDSGQVRFEWHDMAWEGQESTDAANAAHCAGDQGQFWEMHDLLYQSQHSTPNTGAFTRANLETMGGTLGLEPSTFNACVDAGTHVAAVEADTRASSQAGFSGTPAFSVNGRVMIGYQTLDELRAAIEAATSAP